MAEKNPEWVIRKQEEDLSSIIDEGVFGPPRSDSNSEFTDSFDFNNIPVDPGSSFEDIFPCAGSLVDCLEVGSFAEVLNFLSANPRSEGEGYTNKAGLLYAVDSSVNSQMVLGLKESTYLDALSDFEDKNLVYFDDEESPQITSTGKAVKEGLTPLVTEFEDYQDASRILSRVAGRKPYQEDRLLTFLYSMETEESFTEIADNLEAGRRAATIRYEKMRDDHGLFIGEPDNRKRTPRGENTYQSIAAMAHMLDRVSSREYLSHS
ncbi:hypothetical protein [Candidatus Nanohalobium constans]|uniref:Uncharacterized protein n=1 Tax=Candidatus Nanohalobium constans TaxID=2565781 RepID=A0A5Q0UHM9_9ARCH|nr:hypothetical protein [Candidatus Nanohalobium constans]QGA80399.1 hypothetical protein LC1Nh_0499 [Candidatus Nanohalobium constans]